MEREAFIAYLDHITGIESTEEQIEFFKDYTQSMISFSLPGTGKTATATKGLLIAEKYDKIPGEQIYALSFTRNAAQEIAYRHRKMCERLHIRQKVNFSTLHSLCRKILVENYKLLDMDACNIVEVASIEDTKDVIEELCTDNGITLKKGQAKNIARAISFSNSSFVFDPAHLITRTGYQSANVEYELFNFIRQQLYLMNKFIGQVPRGDIPLYALDLMTKHPEVSEEFKSKCKVMVVDEFQDLSLLQLSIIHKLADTVIAIGDINQQIYNFNGACQEIVTRFEEYYPNHRVANLTQSFRCLPAIANFSHGIIEPNMTGGELLKGVENKGEGLVRVHDNPGMIDKVISDIGAEYDTYGRFLQSYMFMYRNNFSGHAVIDKLYQSKVPVIVKDYLSIPELPIIFDLCRMIDLLQNPTTPSFIGILAKFIPEFGRFKRYQDIPLYEIMLKTGMSFMAINYDYRDMKLVTRIMELFEQCSELISQDRPVTKIFEILFKMYDHATFQFISDFVDYSWESISSLVSQIAGNMSFSAFMVRESDKKRHIEDSAIRGIGVKCLTFHGAKGLEADICHIIDAEASIIPSLKYIKQSMKLGCELDAARDIRNERSLCYVAVTRAKKELHLHFVEQIAPMLIGMNEFKSFDMRYQTTQMNFLDNAMFEEFIHPKEEE